MVGIKYSGLNSISRLGFRGSNTIKQLDKYCQLLTGAYSVNSNIMTDKTGNSYNWFNDGVILRIDAIYPELVLADVNNLIYDTEGAPKDLLIATLPNVSYNQLFFNSETNKVLFFSVPLAGTCLVDANKYMGFNEPLFTSEGEPVYTQSSDRVYVYKEGITRTGGI